MAVLWVEEEDECCSDGGIPVQSASQTVAVAGKERFRDGPLSLAAASDSGRRTSCCNTELLT